jgi:hypothetical protein
MKQAGVAMRRAFAGVLCVCLTTTGIPAVAMAAQKTVVLPFDLILQKKEEDFFIGAGKPSPAEQARLQAINDELRNILAADGEHEVIDNSPIAKDIEAAAPIVDCNGCEIDLAKKLNGEVLYTGLVDKASETLLNMRIMEIDVATGQLKRAGNVVVQGNTDEAWLRGVRWLMKNKLPAEEASSQKPGAVQ